MTLLRRLSSNLVLGLQLLILFTLLFGNRMEFPAWLQSFGRMHPLLLHLPISLVILSALLLFFRSEFKKKSFYKFQDLILMLAALTASATAFMGLVLAAEEGYDADALATHQNGGVILSFLVWFTWLTHSHFPERRNTVNVLSGASALFVVLAGHYGAKITHGENFISQPLMTQEDEAVAINDSTALFAMAVQPILKAKCVSCHNEKKAKGELVMTSPEKIMVGGEHGAVWVAGKPDSSLLIQRVLLPVEDDDHMPPSGKTQLTNDEINLLTRWIASGADFTKAWTKFLPTDTLRQLATKLHRQPTKATRLYTFEFASAETIEQLNTPYCTVQPIASGEPALKADFYIGSQFNPEQLKALSEVKTQLVQLNLSGMPVTDEMLTNIQDFENLEKLNLNNTLVTDKGLDQLSKLTKLQSLSLDGTKVGFASLQSLNLPALKSVFVWNTSLKGQELEQLRNDKKKNWVTGYTPTDKLKLTPPLLVNETLLLDANEKVTLKHNLPGTTIQYTLDGTEPDSTRAAIYKDAISIDGYTVIKARAVKEGWFTSSTVTHHFFKKGIQPESAKLLTQPSKDYKGGGASALIDLKPGDADNFRDKGWMGFQDNAAVALFDFGSARLIQDITVSYNKNIGSHLMPPESVELWAGESPEKLSLIGKIKKPLPSGYEPTKVEGVVVATDHKPHRYYKVVVNPVAKLPSWHSGKGKKGWVFIDEVIFQ